MTYVKGDRQKSNSLYLKNVSDTDRDPKARRKPNRLVEIDKQKYEYIKRLLILYKAQLRQTGECHYPPIVAIVKQNQ